MADDKGQEKTEQATSKKLTEQRKEGKVAKSTEINSFAVFFFGLLILFAFRNFIGSNLGEFALKIFSSLDKLSLNINMIQLYFAKFILFFFWTISPVLIGILIAGLAANIGQVGLKISFKALKPKLSKFNPIEGIKGKLFSSKSVVEVLKSLLKMILIGGLTYFVIDDLILESVLLVDMTVYGIMNYMIDFAVTLIWKIGLLYAVFAIADFIWQKYKFKKDMKMTKQEVKEEHKQTEGDPNVKGKIKSLQFEAAKKRMMQEVPTADVVITNPTHFAIALKYELSNDHAPKVVAKGTDSLAQKIKEVAAENNVPLYEDKQLARAIYKICEVGEFIPESLFHAVAKILAYVFNLKNSKKRKSIV